MNNHIQSVSEYKIFVNDRFDKLEKNTLNKTIEALPAKYDQMQYEQIVKKLAADVESLRNDQLA